MFCKFIKKNLNKSSDIHSTTPYKHPTILFTSNLSLIDLTNSSILFFLYSLNLTSSKIPCTKVPFLVCILSLNYKVHYNLKYFQLFFSKRIYSQNLFKMMLRWSKLMGFWRLTFLVSVIFIYIPTYNMGMREVTYQPLWFVIS